MPLQSLWLQLRASMIERSKEWWMKKAREEDNSEVGAGIMGQSTDALLVYGVPLHEDEDLSYDAEDENAPKDGPRYMAYMGKSEDGVSIVDHCSSDSPMYFVAINGVVFRASRG